MERKYSFLRRSYEVRNNDLCGGDHHPSVHLTRTLYQRLHRLSDFHEILYSYWVGVNLSTSRQLFVIISHAEFHGNPTNGLIADTRSGFFFSV